MVNIDEREVFKLLQSTREIKAEIKLIEAYDKLTKAAMQDYEEYGNQQLLHLQCLSKIIEIWRSFLTEEERLIVDRHIIEDVDWRRFCVEYTKRWDAENVRSESTFKRKQMKLIQRIADYTNQYFPPELVSLIKKKVNSVEEDSDEFDKSE